MLNTVNSFFSLLTIATQVGIVILLLSFITPLKITHFVVRHAVKIAFATTLTATLTSLFYSDIIGIEPCKLCWFQRIFMYPLIILIPLALWKKDKNITIYGMSLSAIGGLIGFYHHLLQIGIVTTLPCAVNAVSCTQRFVFTYGYITFPLMSATAFTLIFLLMLLKYRSDNQKR